MRDLSRADTSSFGFAERLWLRLPVKVKILRKWSMNALISGFGRLRRTFRSKLTNKQSKQTNRSRPKSKSFTDVEGLYERPNLRTLRMKIAYKTGAASRAPASYGFLAKVT